MGDQTDHSTPEELFDVVFNQDAIGMALRAVDPTNARWLRVNQKFCDMLGYTREELLQLTPVDVSLPDERHLAVSYNQQLLSADQSSYSREKRYLRRDGTAIWTNIWLSAVLDRDGNPTQIISVVEDISERKAVEEALRESEALHRQSARMARLGHWEWDDVAGKLLSCSEEHARIFGMSVDEMLAAENAFEESVKLIHPEDRDRYRNSVRRIDAQQSEYELEYRIITRSGAIRHLLEVGKPVLDEAGRLVRSIGTLQDITERKQAEEALRLSETSLTNALDNMSDGFIYYDANECLVQCNQRYREFYPWIEDVLVPGVHLEQVARAAAERGQDAQPMNDVGAWVRERLSDFRSGRTAHEQHLRDGRWLLCSENRTEDGGMIGIRTDISERKQVEETLRKARDDLEVRVKERTVELRESESQFKQAARTARLGHWHFDDIANKYVSISEEYARIFGHTVEEFLEYFRALDEDMELVHPEDRANVLDAYAKALDEREMIEGVDIDYRIFHRDGGVRHVRESCRRIYDEAGCVIETVGTLQDITELKEAQLEAEQANRAKSEFLSRMSHELRTPMNAILGFGQLLQSTPTEQFGEKQQGFIGHILGAGQHLLTLIDEVLDLARIESGRTQLFMEAVDPGEVLEECTKLTQSLVEKESLGFENRVATANPPAVWADRTRLKQVLLNLITNAVKYNRVEGQVRVSCEQPRAGMLRISVSDTGLGIPEESIGELFEPFSRFHEKNKGVEGTGIGLTITKRLVEMMGGTLGVESTPGEGSTFWVELGLDPGGSVACGEGEAALAGAEARPADTASRRHLALYIEDDPASLKLVREVLAQRRGAVMFDAPNAQFGMELARSERPDVILMDINLPGTDGFAVLTALAADEATRAIPVIAVSANAIPKEIERARQAGFLDYITKPIDFERLNDALDRALSRDAC